ncbi:MAG TPA: MauE/DoxX family redox-associated membrane protein [Candidatus Polarisedimenticolaceae bacterium]|nr:MauE/DoxX family redox-associated membrane protein [Candidatus Polarisedimenticolaceae bacterium]
MPRAWKSPGVIRAAQIVVGVLFGWAALAKLADLSAFALQVHNFRLLPIAAENLVAMLLPWVELVAALALVLGIRARAGAWVAGLLLAVFTLGVASAMARGLDFECGCFGKGSATRVGWGKLAQNLGMLLLAWIGTWKPESAPGTVPASDRAAEPSLSR